MLFGPRQTHIIYTYIISCEISIEHPSVRLASLAQLVSVDQVRFCGELLLFFLIFFFFFFFFFFPYLFFFSFSKSWDGFSPWKNPLFTYHSFFFLPFFSPSFTLLFPPPFLSYSNFFLPLSPCLPFYSLPIFLLSILVCFFFFPSTSVNIQHNSSITDKCHQHIFTINVRPHKLTLLFHILART